MNGTNLSIIVPCYNVAGYVSDCLESILNQKGSLINRKIRIICVNDASRDETKKILEKYSNEYKNVILLSHTKNKGVSAARNTGLSICSDSRAIMFVDGDDRIGAKESGGQFLHRYYNPYHLQELLEASFQKHVGLACGNSIRLSEDGTMYMPSQWKSYMEDRSYTSSDLLQNLHWANRNISVWNKIYDARIVTKPENMFQTGLRYSEDTLFIMKYLLSSPLYQVSHVHSAQYAYRLHDNSAIGKAFGKRADPLRLIEFYYSRCYYYAEILKFIRDRKRSDLDSAFNFFAKRFANMKSEINGHKTERTSLVLENLVGALPKRCSYCKHDSCEKCREKGKLMESVQLCRNLILR